MNVKSSKKKPKVALVLQGWRCFGCLSPTNHAYHPQTMDDVLWRQKQIQHASRMAHHIDAVATKLNLRQTRELLWAESSEDAATAGTAERQEKAGRELHRRTQNRTGCGHGSSRRLQPASNR
jgi:hypothetical protein